MARQEAQPERQPADAARLVDQYRSIGPAAVLAALVCKRDTDKKPLLADKAR